jgi:protein-arginine kinase
MSKDVRMILQSIIEQEEVAKKDMEKKKYSDAVEALKEVKKQIDQNRQTLRQIGPQAFEQIQSRIKKSLGEALCETFLLELEEYLQTIQQMGIQPVTTWDTSRENKELERMIMTH